MLTMETLKAAIVHALASDMPGYRANEVAERVMESLGKESHVPDARMLAYAAIDGERQYQDAKWGEMDAANPLTVGEFVLLLEQYAGEARATWSREFKPNDRTVEVVRKVGALAVACMEQHGAPRRLPDPLMEELCPRCDRVNTREVYCTVKACRPGDNPGMT